MTTNFTFREFIVYLLTGITFILCISLILRSIIFVQTVSFFTHYEFIKEFSFLVTIFLIPLVYLLGHLINTFDYFTLKYFVWLHGKFKKSKYRVVKWVLSINELLFYRQRIVFQIVKHWKSDRQDKSFNATEDFWVLCAKLQKSNHYLPAEYWYVLNDLFKAVYLVFIISSIVAIIHHYWILTAVFLGLSIFSFLRAKQYAEFFVLTVCRLSKP
jgi:hypothetical protein